VVQLDTVIQILIVSRSVIGQPSADAKTVNMNISMMVLADLSSGQPPAYQHREYNYQHFED